MSGIKRPAKERPIAARGHSQADPVPDAELAATANEIRTKLDLARQFIDLGDPESARHMLDEVLEEGDAAQKQEATRLVDLLPR